MSNLLLIRLYSALLVLMLVMLGLTLRKKQHGKIAVNLAAVECCVAGWLAVLICYNLTTNRALATYLYDLDLPLAGFTSVSLFLFVLHFYGKKSHNSPMLISVLCIFPCITTALALTSPWHPYLREDFTMFQTVPSHVVVNTPGVWFMVHAGFCYVMLLCIMCMSLFYFRRIPRLYRKSARFLIIGVVTVVSSNLVTVLKLLPATRIDISLVCSALLTVMLYGSKEYYQNMAFLSQAKQIAFAQLDTATMIFSKDGTLRHYNQRASLLLTRLGLKDVPNLTFEYIIGRFDGRDSASPLQEDSEGTDYVLQNVGGEMIYHVSEKEITDRDGNRIGMAASIANVTRNRELLRRLAVEAGVDALTNLSNRQQIMKLCSELEQQSVMPLSVIVGDLNGLKVVNDTLGHAYGDVYLRAAAECLVSACPPEAQIARIGGDEFLILLPAYTLAQAEHVAQGVHQRMAATVRLPFTASVSLGCAERQASDQSLRELIEQADARMYEQKKASRMGRGQTPHEQSN